MSTDHFKLLVINLITQQDFEQSARCWDKDTLEILKKIRVELEKGMVF